MLGLAYDTGALWHESYYVNSQFDAFLTEAEGTLDLEKRKALLEKPEVIMQERSV